MSMVPTSRQVSIKEKLRETLRDNNVVALLCRADRSNPRRKRQVLLTSKNHYMQDNRCATQRTTRKMKHRVGNSASSSTIQNNNHERKQRRTARARTMHVHRAKTAPPLAGRRQRKKNKSPRIYICIYIYNMYIYIYKRINLMGLISFPCFEE